MKDQNVKQTNLNTNSIAISAKELATLLGVSLRQIWRLNATAKLPKPVRLGGSVRWLREEIAAFLKAGCPDRQIWEIMKGGDK